MTTVRAKLRGSSDFVAIKHLPIYKDRQCAIVKVLREL